MYIYNNILLCHYQQAQTVRGKLYYQERTTDKMSTEKEGKKTGNPVKDGIRRMNKKGKTSSEYTITKFQRKKNGSW